MGTLWPWVLMFFGEQIAVIVITVFLTRMFSRRRRDPAVLCPKCQIPMKDFTVIRTSMSCPRCFHRLEDI